MYDESRSESVPKDGRLKSRSKGAFLRLLNSWSAQEQGANLTFEFGNLVASASFSVPPYYDKIGLQRKGGAIIQHGNLAAWSATFGPIPKTS
jgi:hypothetical protein